jgi:hypothetical protein
MAKWNWERLAAGSGILFVVLFIVAFVIPGKPPTMSADNTKWVHYVLSNSREIKVSSILLGLALITFVWFAGSLAARLRYAGESRLAAIAFGGAVATAAVRRGSRRRTAHPCVSPAGPDHGECRRPRLTSAPSSCREQRPITTAASGSSTGALPRARVTVRQSCPE